MAAGWVPLLLATALPVAALLLARMTSALPLWLRVVWDIGVFVVFTLIVQRVLGSPFEPRFEADHTGEQLWRQLVEAGWWLMGGRLAVGLARALVVLENRPRETQIVSDLLAGAIYVATALAIVNFAFAVPIRGLLATSGVIAIVLGLALQSTLADVFSGIAVGVERPYKVGDLLWVEGGIEGQVLQLNWRSTQIATLDGNIAVVPNSIMAKARLVNRSAPTARRGQTLEIRLDAAVPPERGIATLRAAVLAARLPLADPAPTVGCVGVAGDGAAFEIGYSVVSSDVIREAHSELTSLVHRHLSFAGIALAVPRLAAPPPVPVPTAEQVLARSDLFAQVEPAQLQLLAGRLTPVVLRPGEVLLRQGAKPEALFAIASGTLEIAVDGPTGAAVVARMGPGDCIGVIGMLTGSDHAATATALTPLLAYRLSKQDLAAAIKATPELASALEALAQRGLATLRRGGVPHEDARLAHPNVFQSRLRNFLRRLNG